MFHPPGIFDGPCGPGPFHKGDLKYIILALIKDKPRYGYEIMDRLPELFLDIKGVDSHKLRRDYWDCYTHLFVETFTRPYAERCAKLGLDMTGHYLAEQTLASRTSVAGATMRHYEHMQSPGIDILREQITEILTVKQCSSVARQFGRKRVLSELYGCRIEISQRGRRFFAHSLGPVGEVG